MNTAVTTVSPANFPQLLAEYDTVIGVGEYQKYSKKGNTVTMVFNNVIA